MTISKETTIWCDGEDCTEWRQENIGSIQVARNAAMAGGWRFTKGLDVCPQCFADMQVAR